MNERKRQYTLSLSSKHPEQRIAMDILEKIPKGKRTEYICKRLAERERADELAAIVYANTMKALYEYGGTITKTNTARAHNAGDVDSDILGFLSALQEEGSDDD